MSDRLKRPVLTIKESMKVKKSNNGKGDIVVLVTNSKLDDYYEALSKIDIKKFPIEEEKLKLELRQKRSTGNLEIMRYRKEAREMDPTITEEKLNAWFPFIYE